MITSVRIPHMTTATGFAENTPIIMFDGTTKCIEDIEVGDELMNTDGTANTVTKVTKSEQKMYDVIPVKGNNYTIAGDHILQLKVGYRGTIRWYKKYQTYQVMWLANLTMRTRSFSVSAYGSKKNAHKQAIKFQKDGVPLQEGYMPYGEIISVRLSDFVNIPKHIQRLQKGFCTGIEFDEINVDVDPYIFGYWLGDGHSGSTGITTAEHEIVEYFEKFAKDNNLVFSKIGNSKYHYNVTSGKNYGKHNRNPFLNFLKKYNLLNNKHIPNDYLMNSRENRLKLLAGLVDSDGHNAGNCYDFTFKSKQLTDDIVFLIKSLGFQTFCTKVKKTCTNGANGPVTGTYYRFNVHGEGLEQIPSILKRKQASKRKQIKDACVTGLTIYSAGTQDCYTLKTTGKNFLLGDFTMVHR